MAEDKIIWLGIMTALSQAVKISLAPRLADHQARASLARDIECDPVAVLVPECIHIAPLEGPGLALSHA